ncbi:MAG: hypothetical protein ACLFSE_03890 [Spirochaetia bacterium]
MKFTDHYKHMVRQAETVVPRITARQVHDTEDREFGGFRHEEQGYAEPGVSIAQAFRLVSLYTCRDSIYYHDRTLLEHIVLFLTFSLQKQHSDGTIDLMTTNYHCAATMAFSMQNAVPAYRLLNLDNEGAAEEARDLLYRYIERGGEGMRTGGFHTPNHRWVMASALSLAYRVTKDERLKEEALTYLGEGIDCNEYGEYTERSVGVYNHIVNRSLIMTARELEQPELLDPVRKNLNSLVYYIEPDDSLYTLTSRRQDYGTLTYPLQYYDNFLCLAAEDPHYSWMADYIFRSSLNRGNTPGGLHLFLLQPELKEKEYKSAAPDFSYRHYNPVTGIARIRSGNQTVSILSKNTVFLKYQRGGIALHARFAGTFFGTKGRFTAENIKPEGEGFALRYECRWGYIRPLKEAPATTVWEEIDHSKREKVNLQDYIIEMEVEPRKKGTRLHVTGKGTEEVLCKLELIITPGGILRGEGLSVRGIPGGSAIFSGKQVSYHLKGDSLTLRGGASAHNYAEEMRGGEPQDTGSFTLYLTFRTPFSHTLEIL